MATKGPGGAGGRKRAEYSEYGAGEERERIAAYVPTDMAEWVREQAALDERTLSWVVNDALREYRAKREARTPLKEQRKRKAKVKAKREGKT